MPNSDAEADADADACNSICFTARCENQDDFSTSLGLAYMRLSEKTKNCLLAPFAISPIMQRFSLPGLIGMLLFGVGVWRHLAWLKVTGIIFAAPIIWVYAVIMLVYFPYLVFDSIRRRLNKTK